MLEHAVQVAGLCRVSLDWLVWGDAVASNVDARLRRIPKILRDGLIQRLHDEIDRTEELAKRLPKELAADVLNDNDHRLTNWSAANLASAKKASGRSRRAASDDPPVTAQERKRGDG
jgi:hypothetical protein